MSERTINLEWLLGHTETAKKIISAVVAEETSEDIAAMKALIGEGVDETTNWVGKMTTIIENGVGIAFDIMREPLAEAGYEIDSMRDIPSFESEKVKERLLEVQENE